VTPDPGKTYIEKHDDVSRVLVVTKVVRDRIHGYYWHFESYRTTACNGRLHVDRFASRFELSPVQISPDLVI
jgi:hypothetical protein